MKLGTILVALFFAVCGLAGVVYLSYDFDKIEPEEPKNIVDDLDEELPVSETGPWPAAVVDETTYDFGAMEVGTKADYTFIIRNEGEAPLKLLKGPTTCRCTLSEVAEEPIPPGESVEVRLEWAMNELAPEFRQTADIFTNDPEHRTITFEITGSGVEVVQFDPAQNLILGDMEEGEPLIGAAYLWSAMLPEFEILEVESSSPHLTATTSPASAEKLDTYRAQCGYRLEVTLQPDIPVGSFNGLLTVKTDVNGGKEYSVEVSALRVGPIKVLPAKGIKWFPDRQLVFLDRFGAETGKSADLFLFVRGMDAPFEWEIVETDPAWLEVEIVRGEGKVDLANQRFVLKLNVPPGSPPVARTGNNPGLIRLKTNHPEVPELEFKLHFISY